MGPLAAPEGSMRVLLLIITLSFPLSPAAGEAVRPEKEPKSIAGPSELEYRNSLDTFQARHQQIIADLAFARDNISQFIEKLREFDSSLGGRTPEPQELQEAFSNGFGSAVTVLFRSLYDAKRSRFDLDPDRVRAAIDEALSMYKMTTADICFADRGVLSGTEECLAFTKTCSDDLQLGAVNGRLYFERINDDYAIEKIYVDTNSDVEWNLTQADPVLDDQVSFCRLAALSGQSFKPARPRGQGYALDTTFDNLLRPEEYGYLDHDVFVKSCITFAPPKEKVSRLRSLRSKYRDETVLSDRYRSYQGWKASCDKAARSLCGSTYVSDGRIVVRYEAADCKMREVAESDISDDLRRREGGPGAETGRSQKASIVDVLRTCRQARDAGYSWQFVQPTPDPACRSKGKNK
jgi:hypothetical protein